MGYRTSIEKAALKTLEQLGYTWHESELWKPPIGKSASPLLDKIDLLEARIAALTKDAEPVATVLDWVNGSNWRNYTIDWHSHVPKGAKLYTHPPAPELKPLSLDEIHQRYKNLRGNEPPHYIDIYRDAEAALGILRGGL